MAREKTEAEAFEPTITGSLPTEAYMTEQDKHVASGEPYAPVDEAPESEAAAARRKKDEDAAKARKAKDDEDEKAKHNKKGR